MRRSCCREPLIQRPCSLKFTRLDSFPASPRPQILHVRAGFPPWGRPPATRQRQTSHAEQAPCPRPHSPVAMPALLRLRCDFRHFLFFVAPFPAKFFFRRRRRLSLLVKIEGDPLNTQRRRPRLVTAVRKGKHSNRPAHDCCVRNTGNTNPSHGSM